MRGPELISAVFPARDRKKLFRALLLFCACAAPLGPGVRAQDRTDMIAVSADIVEIAGSSQKTAGVAWDDLQAVIIGEGGAPAQIPTGIIRLGDFQRRSYINTTLKLLETEGKAQMLSNPKIITKNGTTASFEVGGKFYIPVINGQGVGSESASYKIALNVLPFIVSGKKDTVNVQLELMVETPNYARSQVVGNTTVPGVDFRTIKTEAEFKSGETLVIGGLKTSSRNVSKKRVPILGSIPLIGALFRTTDIMEDQRSLFLFVTLEVLK